MTVAIHCNSGIAWQAKRAEYFSAGLKVLGIDHIITDSRIRVADNAILFGTTFWRGIEGCDGNWLLVDRASWGDPEFVSLVWNGHGRRGNHMVPDDRGGRDTPELQPWRTGSRVVLCGQTETYSPNYAQLPDWYSVARATHFRSHPTGENPTGLPRAKDWSDCRLAVTLNSSVAVDAVIAGVPTVTMDEAAMAWDVTSHTPDEVITPDRRPWLEWLSWTQWHWDEIRDGLPIAHLFKEL